MIENEPRLKRQKPQTIGFLSGNAYQEKSHKKKKGPEITLQSKTIGALSHIINT